jgi:hypothetical protein
MVNSDYLVKFFAGKKNQNKSRIVEILLSTFRVLCYFCNTFLKLVDENS